METDLVLHLDYHTSTGPDEMHPRVLRELVVLTAKLLSCPGQPEKSQRIGGLPARHPSTRRVIKGI